MTKLEQKDFEKKRTIKGQTLDKKSFCLCAWKKEEQTKDKFRTQKFFKIFFQAPGGAV